MPAEQWRRQASSALDTCLSELGQRPADSRAWRGSIYVTFDDVPESSAILNADVLEFLRETYRRWPHAWYYLSPEQEHYTVLSWICAHAVTPPVESPDGFGVAYDDGLPRRAESALVAAAEHAVQMGDDWYAVVKPHLETIEILNPSFWSSTVPDPLMEPDIRARLRARLSPG